MNMHKKFALFALAALAALPAFGDQKVSARVSLSAGSLDPANDLLSIVDVSAGSAGSKKMVPNALFTGWGFTSDGESIAKAANFASMRTSLGLVIGTNVQAWDTDLDTWAGKTAPSGTAVGTSDTQTLTNKTLTSPVINVGSDAAGDLYYRSSGGSFSRLPAGSDGDVLKLAAGLPSWVAASGALDNWTSAVSTSSPNATVPVVSFAATNAATNVDAVLIAKGTGARLAQVPDGTATGGNKRGGRTVDFQTVRSSANQVAAAGSSFLGSGENNSILTAASYSFLGAGLSNQISDVSGSGGNNSVLVGGGSNLTNGNYAALLGGQSNTSYQHGFVGGGQSNSTSSIGTHGVVAGGLSNSLSGAGNYCSILGGTGNTITNGTSAWIPGGEYATNRGISGVGTWSAGRFSATGDAQRGEFLLRRATTDATTTELSTTGGTPGSTNRIVLPNNHAYAVRGRVVARDTSSGDAATWEIKSAIKRGANAAATALVGSPTVTLLFNDAGAATWTVTLTADTTNGSLKIEVTGEAGETIHWLAEIETLEVG